MFQFNTFWSPASARSIHDTAQVVWQRRRGVHWSLLSQPSQLLEAKDSEMSMGAVEDVQVCLINIVLTVRVVNNVLNILGIFQGVGESLQKVGLQKYRFSLGRYQGMSKSFFSQCIIGCDNGY